MRNIQSKIAVLLKRCKHTTLLTYGGLQGVRYCLACKKYVGGYDKK